MYIIQIMCVLKIIIIFILNKALACTNHVINDKKIDPKKAKARHVKLFVGGLISRITDDDIKDYFQRYTPHILLETKFDRIQNKRKGFF